MFATRRLLSSASAHAVLPLVAACAFSACGGPEEEPRVQVPDGAVAGDFATEPCTYEIKAGAFAADCGTLVVDVAVPNTAYPEIIAAIGDEMKTTGIMGYTFGHAGDGNVHFNIPGKKGDQKQWTQIDKLVQRLVSKALDLGGTATGEHGVGLGKKKYMAAEHGKSLDWMKQIKTLFDPNGILNPGKIFP